jgi:hypothetical protein
MKDELFDSAKLSTTTSANFMAMVENAPQLIMHRGVLLYRATVDLPAGKDVRQVLIYSDFSRYSKKAIAQKVKGKSAIEVVCGYGHGRNKSFFLSN